MTGMTDPSFDTLSVVLPLVGRLVIVVVAVLLLAAIIAVLVGFVIEVRRFKRAVPDVNANLLELAESRPDATVVGGVVATGFRKALRRLSIGPADSARFVGVMADAMSLTLWSLETPYHRFATIPAASVETLEWRRPSPRAKKVVLTATVRNAVRASELPLFDVPLHPKATTEAGRALLLAVLTENLRHGITTPLPEGFNAYLATEADAAALRSATVRKPALAIDESGVFDERAELR